nr:kelch repeat-containing protein [Ideonella sp.]
MSLRALLAALAVAGLVAGCGGGSEEAGRADASGSRAKAAAATPSSFAQGSWSTVTPSPDPDGVDPSGGVVVPGTPPTDRPTPTDPPGVSTPVAAANLPDGRVLLWAADGRFSFDANITGNTWSGVYDPGTNLITPFNATATGHNMFCPGTTNLPDGRLLISGGIDSKKTTIYDATAAPGVNDAARWSSSGLMNIARAYQANTLLADGSILTLGGSWDGNGVVIATPKNGEKWDPVTGQWTLLRGLLAAPMVGDDPEDALRGGAYRGDNHMWLIPTGWGNVLHAGPAPNMNWIDTRGEGASVPAGTRGDDTYSIAGTTVMYAPGRILKAGGAGAYDYTKSPGGTAYDANNRAYIIDTNTLTTDGSPTVTVTGNPGMTASRVFHNAVVLPNGQVFIVGGQERALLFNDAGARLEAEIWDPDTGQFTAVGAAMTIPRNYHSVAILLPDARVLVGGGGLGGAGPFNHANLEIFTPHYLLD